MYTLISALGVGIAASGLFLFIWNSLWATILPGFFVGLFCFVWINRRVGKRVEALTQQADLELTQAQSIAQRSGAKGGAILLRGMDSSILKLRGALLFSKWQLGLAPMLNGRIGMMLYAKTVVLKQLNRKNDIPEALAQSVPYLEKSMVSGPKAKLLSALWPAWAMLACAHYRLGHDLDKVVEVLEQAVKSAPKNGLLWSIYAWMLTAKKRTDEAVSVLARGSTAASDDPYLLENYTLAQNGKKPRMKPYGEQWYQFGLEQPRMQAGPKTAHPRARMGGRRR